jgi:lipopolysaccharide heptosyltransferase I
LPLIAALRREYPEAHIAWITQPGPASLLADHPLLDEVITVDKNWYRSAKTILQLQATLRDHRFDLTIDPQSLTKSSVLALLSGAKQRIGFSRGQGREISPWLNSVCVKPGATHVVERYLELLRPLGIDAPAVEFQLGVNPAAVSGVAHHCREFDFPTYAVINPGAGWDSKRWPHENYSHVARSLVQRGLGCVVLWAGPRELAWAERIVEMSGRGVHLAPATTLPELAAWCREAQLFVGSDTGPLHLAAALGTPCVALFGPTRPSVCGPYGTGHQTLQAYYQGGSSRQRRGADNRAMREIQVESVIDACHRVLGSATGSAA